MLTCNLPADPHRRMWARRYLRGQSVKGGRGGTCASPSRHRYFRRHFGKLVPASRLRRHRELDFSLAQRFTPARYTCSPYTGTASSGLSRCVSKSGVGAPLFVGVGNEPGLLEIFATADRVWLWRHAAWPVYTALSASVLSPAYPLIRPLPRPLARRSLPTLYTRSSSLSTSTRSDSTPDFGISIAPPQASG